MLSYVQFAHNNIATHNLEVFEPIFVTCFMWYQLLVISWVLMSTNYHTHAQNQSCNENNNTGCSTRPRQSDEFDSKTARPEATATSTEKSTRLDDSSADHDDRNSADRNSAAQKEGSGAKTDTDGDGFDIYHNKLEFTRKLKEGRKAIHQTLRSSYSEQCDWRVSPLKYLKGESRCICNCKSSSMRRDCEGLVTRTGHLLN